MIPRTLQVSNKAPVEFFLPGQEQCWLEARSRGGIELTKKALLLQTDLVVTLRGQLRRSVVEDMVQHQTCTEKDEETSERSAA